VKSERAGICESQKALSAIEATLAKKIGVAADSVTASCAKTLGRRLQISEDSIQYIVKVPDGEDPHVKAKTIQGTSFAAWTKLFNKALLDVATPLGNDLFQFDVQGMTVTIVQAPPRPARVPTLLVGGGVAPRGSMPGNMAQVQKQGLLATVGIGNTNLFQTVVRGAPVTWKAGSTWALSGLFGAVAISAAALFLVARRRSDGPQALPQEDEE